MYVNWINAMLHIWVLQLWFGNSEERMQCLTVANMMLIIGIKNVYFNPRTEDIAIVVDFRIYL